jgi:hypothetical protein
MDDKDKFLALLLRAQEIPLNGLWTVIKSWIDKFWDGLLTEDSISALANSTRTAAGAGDSSSNIISGMNDRAILLSQILQGKEMPVKFRTRNMRERIDQRIEEHFFGIMRGTGKILHFLHDDYVMEDEVRALVQCLPEALSYKVHHEYGRGEDPDESDAEIETFSILPIQNAMLMYGEDPFGEEIGMKNLAAISFIPLLAEEGFKHNVGGDGMRGGLLCRDIDGGGHNVLEHLVRPFRRWQEWEEDEDYDEFCLDVLKKLREMDLFKKEDIKTYRLLSATWEGSRSFRELTFEYLLEWDPDALKECQCMNRTLLHKTASENVIFQNIMIFKRTLVAGLKHYPHEIGFLFHKDDLGESAYTEACKIFGEEGTWDTALGCLEETDPKKVLERNPCTNMYPFMMATSDDSVGCLDVVYYLLRKDPVVLKCAAYIPGDDVTKKRERE